MSQDKNRERSREKIRTGDRAYEQHHCRHNQRPKGCPGKSESKGERCGRQEAAALNVPYILAGYFCDKVAWLWRVSEGADASAKMIAAMNGFDTLFQSPAQLPPKRFTDWSRLRHSPPACGVLQSQERQEIPAWQGVWFRKVGKCQRHRAIHGLCV